MTRSGTAARESAATFSILPRDPARYRRATPAIGTLISRRSSTHRLISERQPCASSLRRSLMPAFARDRYEAITRE